VVARASLPSAHRTCACLLPLLHPLCLCLLAFYKGCFLATCATPSLQMARAASRHVAAVDGRNGGGRGAATKRKWKWLNSADIRCIVIIACRASAVGNMVLWWHSAKYQRGIWHQSWATLAWHRRLIAYWRKCRQPVGTALRHASREASDGSAGGVSGGRPVAPDYWMVNVMRTNGSLR